MALLLQAIILMLWQEAPEYEQNFSMVMRVLEYAEVKEEDEEYVSPLDLLFQSIEREKPDSVAVRQYKVFKSSISRRSWSWAARSKHSISPFAACSYNDAMRHVYVRGMISAIWLIVVAASGVSGKPKDAARYAVLCVLFLYSTYTAWKKAKKDGKKKEIDDGNDTLC